MDALPFQTHDLFKTNLCGCEGVILPEVGGARQKYSTDVGVRLAREGEAPAEPVFPEDRDSEHTSRFRIHTGNCFDLGHLPW